MYIPSYNLEDDPETLVNFMQQHSFATLVSSLNGTLIATHIPIVTQMTGESITLYSHVARANSQWEAFGDAESLVIFSGPHAYISPTLYEKHESVPTWNYAAVHAYGTPRAFTFKNDREATEAMMELMMNAYEPAYREQWESLPEKYRHGMMNGIVGFELPVTRLEGKYKLSQNRSAGEQENVARALQEHIDPTVVSVGELMKEKQS